jgi:hypothetical protein
MPFFPYAGLDSAWTYAMNEAVAHRMVFGRDIIFTFGPYASEFDRKMTGCQFPGNWRLCPTLLMMFGKTRERVAVGLDGNSAVRSGQERMANQIARAWHALKVQEQRLFLWLVGQVDPFDDEDLQQASDTRKPCRNIRSNKQRSRTSFLLPLVASINHSTSRLVKCFRLSPPPVFPVFRLLRPFIILSRVYSVRSPGNPHE